MDDVGGRCCKIARSFSLLLNIISGLLLKLTSLINLQISYLSKKKQSTLLKISEWNSSKDTYNHHIIVDQFSQ